MPVSEPVARETVHGQEARVHTRSSSPSPRPDVVMSFRTRRGHTGMITSIGTLPNDERAFTALAEPHRRELHLHCYRMLASVHDAEDAVQETFLRAWRFRESYAGRSTVRAWLYRIATNASLDIIGRRPSVATHTEDGGRAFEVPWLEPYPEHLLAAVEEQPDAVVVANETVELAFLVAVQHVPPQGRAVLILRDVLGWTAKDTAALLDITVAAVNSSLQRARAVLGEHLPARRSEWSAEAEEAEKELVARYVAVTEKHDAEQLVALIHDDAHWAMPPDPLSITGNRKMLAAWEAGGYGTPEWGDLRCLVTSVNRQPAVAVYRCRPGEDVHRPMALDVLRIEDGRVAEILTFVPGLFASLGLPAEL
jgi:RNA polymerase sigma-70 factor (ECF subfamily)